jgi:hypothetical protein
VTIDNYSGSCICGSVKYEVSGEFRFFFHCHCSRCAKSTGTGHASNVILNPEKAEWTAGEELIGSFKVPDAKRFRTVFCKNCGSPLPRFAPDMSIAVIPAGTLDSSPALSPTGRIFCGSKEDWSCDSSELPVWDEYPEQP